MRILVAALAAFLFSTPSIAVPVDIVIRPGPQKCLNPEDAGHMTGIEFRWDRESRSTRSDSWQEHYDEDTPCKRLPNRSAGKYAFKKTWEFDDFNLATHESQTPYALDLEPGVWYLTAISKYVGSVWSKQSNELRLEVEDPNAAPPVDPPIDPCAASNTCERVAASLVTIAVTSSPLTIEMGEDGVDKEFQLVEYGGSLPSLTEAGVSGPAWTFSPPRAGLFYVRTRRCTDCDWVSSLGSGQLFYIKLATPTGGSIQ